MSGEDAGPLKLEHLRVVVVDDDTIFRTLVLNALRNQAKSRDLMFDAAASEDLGSALAELRRRPTDAVIIDLTLPDSTGLDTLNQVLEEFPDVAVIVLTSDDDDQLGRAATDAGAQDFLPKHFSEPLRMLELTINAVARKRRSQRELESVLHEQQMQRMVAIGTMTSGIVHEHNNLQTALMGNLELLARGSLEADQRKRVERCIAVVERANEITRSLLDFAADHSGDFERVDLRTVAEEAAQATADLATVEGVTVTVRLSRQPVWVAGNKSQLVQVVTNLATNACHAMIGRAERELRIGVDASGNDARVSVTDTGTGIDDQIRARLFDPFFSTKRQRASDRPGAAGTGLGLSVCDSFVRHHDGRIEIESALGHGSTFRVILPLVAAEEADAQAEPSTTMIRSLVLQDREIFVIDPDKAALDRATEILRDAGCVVTSTRSGSVAMRLISHRRPDAILARIDHNGNEDLVAQLQAQHPAVPLAVIVEANASWSPNDAPTATTTLRAPYSSKQLLATLGHLLGPKLVDQD